MKNKKLVLLRDCEGPYDYSNDSCEEALTSAEDNENLAVEFLKNAITECGFEPRKKVDHVPYTGDVRVFIKGFGGGKYYLQCTADFDAAGGYDSDDEIEIDEFKFSCTDYRGMGATSDEEIFYTSYKDIIKNLARDLNKNAGNWKSFSKNDSKKLNAA